MSGLRREGAGVDVKCEHSSILWRRWTVASGAHGSLFPAPDTSFDASIAWLAPEQPARRHGNTPHPSSLSHTWMHCQLPVSGDVGTAEVVAADISIVRTVIVGGLVILAIGGLSLCTHRNRVPIQLHRKADSSLRLCDVLGPYNSNKTESNLIVMGQMEIFKTIKRNANPTLMCLTMHSVCF